jgi:hypothetical protein
MPVVGCTPFALLPRVVRAPVLGRTYSATPTLFHAGLYKILRELEGEGSKFFLRNGCGSRMFLTLVVFGSVAKNESFRADKLRHGCPMAFLPAQALSFLGFLTQV